MERANSDLCGKRTARRTAIGFQSKVWVVVIALLNTAILAISPWYERTKTSNFHQR